ncbi:sensory rhodopsin transducer [Nonomuraea sp. LPB2021202275-12-8]|uniref:sensory rhodopsin transducer n=1 Tax=Nonomuraea sp. LPB2021202275-12-8 TaxID=3120159 RepID=UPI00300D3502
MSTLVGNWKMAITDGCMPGDQLSLFNVSSGNAHVELTFCAEGGQPLGPFRLVIPPQRTQSPTLEDLVDSDVRPPSLPYSVVVVSDAPVLVQPHQADQDVPKSRRSAA